jgi:hypothetical protein
MPMSQASLWLINRSLSEQNTDGGLVSMSYKVYAAQYTRPKYFAYPACFGRSTFRIRIWY